jgi:hypothetical protein
MFVLFPVTGMLQGTIQKYNNTSNREQCKHTSYREQYNTTNYKEQYNNTSYRWQYKHASYREVVLYCSCYLYVCIVPCNWCFLYCFLWLVFLQLFPVSCIVVLSGLIVISSIVPCNWYFLHYPLFFVITTSCNFPICFLRTIQK